MADEFDVQDFQNRGEPYRQQLGIDGTAGDAQDIVHPFVPDPPFASCIVCGLGPNWKAHSFFGINKYGKHTMLTVPGGDICVKCGLDYDSEVHRD